ncbi:unnamed protein product [Leuciscus chuanchicus]
MIVAAAGVEQEIQTPQLQSQKPLQKETGGERRGTRKHKTTGKGRSQQKVREHPHRAWAHKLADRLSNSEAPTCECKWCFIRLSPQFFNLDTNMCQSQQVGSPILKFVDGSVVVSLLNSMDPNNSSVMSKIIDWCKASFLDMDILVSSNRNSAVDFQQLVWIDLHPSGVIQQDYQANQMAFKRATNDLPKITQSSLDGDEEQEEDGDEEQEEDGDEV